MLPVTCLPGDPAEGACGRLRYVVQPFRERLRCRGIRPDMPHRGGKKPRRGWKAQLAGHRERWHLERSFAWLGRFRRVLARYDRPAAVYQAFLMLAAIIVCLRQAILG